MAVFSAVANVIGASKSAKAAKSAANTQAAAADRATELEREIYYDNKKTYEPFLEQGKNALSRYSDIVLGGKQNLFQQSPGYQFRFDEGRRAIENSAVARGVGTSGNTYRALTEYGQGVASDEYTNYLNQLLGLMGYGQVGAQGTAAAGNNYAARAGENMMAAGTARASGITGQANAINAGIGNVGNSLSNWWGASQQQPGYTAAAASFYNPGTFNASAFASGLPWSDRALKKDIKLVGKENGFNIYEFRYKHPDFQPLGHEANALWRGVIAQEVAEVMPEAVWDCGPYLAVDYNKIGVQFMRAA